MPSALAVTAGRGRRNVVVVGRAVAVIVEAVALVVRYGASKLIAGVDEGTGDTGVFRPALPSALANTAARGRRNVVVIGRAVAVIVEAVALVVRYGASKLIAGVDEGTGDTGVFRPALPSALANTAARGRRNVVVIGRAVAVIVEAVALVVRYGASKLIAGVDEGTGDTGVFRPALPSALANTAARGRRNVVVIGRAVAVIVEAVALVVRYGASKLIAGVDEGTGDTGVFRPALPSALANTAARGRRNVVVIGRAVAVIVEAVALVVRYGASKLIAGVDEGTGDTGVFRPALPSALANTAARGRRNVVVIGRAVAVIVEAVALVVRYGASKLIAGVDEGTGDTGVFRPALPSALANTAARGRRNVVVIGRAVAVIVEAVALVVRYGASKLIAGVDEGTGDTGVFRPALPSALANTAARGRRNVVVIGRAVAVIVEAVALVVRYGASKLIAGVDEGTGDTGVFRPALPSALANTAARGRRNVVVIGRAVAVIVEAVALVVRYGASKLIAGVDEGTGDTGVFRPALPSALANTAARGRRNVVVIGRAVAVIVEAVALVVRYGASKLIAGVDEGTGDTGVFRPALPSALANTAARGRRNVVVIGRAVAVIVEAVALVVRYGASKLIAGVDEGTGDTGVFRPALPSALANTAARGRRNVVVIGRAVAVIVEAVALVVRYGASKLIAGVDEGTGDTGVFRPALPSALANTAARGRRNVVVIGRAVAVIVEAVALVVRYGASKLIAGVDEGTGDTGVFRPALPSALANTAARGRRNVVVIGRAVAVIVEAVALVVR